MKTLATINFENVEEKEFNKFKVRNAVRVVIFDKIGNIALMDVTSDSFHKLPGGGIEKGEDNEKAMRRECLEEAGVEIGNLIELGCIKEIKRVDEMVQNSFCYATKVSGEKKEPHFTDSEMSRGYKVLWIKIDEAIKLISSDTYSNIVGRYIKERELNILIAAKNNVSNL
jgi:8-oxo-dGTP pyrophosphatase MutT (NUDIX family)